MSSYALPLLMLVVITTVAGVGIVWGSIRLSHRLDILDRPHGRKAHREPVAYLGGLGMLLTFLVGLLLFAGFFPGLVFLHWDLFVGVVVGAVGIFLVGFVDDVRPVRAVLKLLLQITMAALMWWWGVRVELLSVIGDGRAELGLAISAMITIGWYVSLMNSINLVDGLDGLAGGICLIGGLSLVGIGFAVGHDSTTFIGTGLAALVVAATVAFLCWNWHPAKTFMGDGGSLLLGFLLATASIVGSTKTTTALALAVPMVALALPLFETGFSFLRRLLRGQHPFKPDRRHLHHRLLDLGLDHRRVVLILLFFTAFLGINSVLMAQIQSSILFLNVLFVIGGIVLLIENMRFLEGRRDAMAREQPGPTTGG